MTTEEYLKAKKAIEEECASRKKMLAGEFARSNNPVKIGDIITDHYKTIRVEKFSWTIDLSQTPCMCYRGTRLNKKGEPAKREADDNLVFQNNIIKINGNPYKYEVK